MKYTFAGVDPGLIHTGVVVAQFDDQAHTITVEPHLVDGLDVPAVVQIVTNRPIGRVVIEGYRPRSNFKPDAAMVAAIASLQLKVPSTAVLPNMGIKQVVGNPLLDVLGMRYFQQRSHHQDLRSAARIMVLWMLKQEVLNQLLATIVGDHLLGRPWQTTHERIIS